MDTSSRRRSQKSAYHRILINLINAQSLFFILSLSNLFYDRSVAMNLDHFTDCDAFSQQKFVNVASLIALKLNDRSVLLVFDDGTVAAPGFFELA